MKHNHFTGKPEYQSFNDVYRFLSAGLKKRQNKDFLHQALQYVVDAQDENDHRPSSLEIAYTLKKLGVDAQTLIATLLTDPRLRDKLDPLFLEEQFNERIANLAKHVNWLNTFKEADLSLDYIPEQAEALRRLLLATVNDVRAVLIRLAFRLQRLRKLYHEPRKTQYAIAKETLDIFTPLANRLGIGQLKWEMEDLAFRYLDPENYMAIAKSMDINRAKRESIINDFVDQLQGLFAGKHLRVSVYGRAKHLYSIWKKMQRKNKECHELADLLAVRIVVEDIPQCYQVLGIVHSIWKHLPQEFDDYIANPKENGYQSIHTAIFGPIHQVVEIQIRTQEMQEFAEHGVAAHWRYKEGSSQDQAMESTIQALRDLLENPVDDDSLLEELKPAFLNERVYLLTPKGAVIDLPQKATALDFAYFVHTEIGHHCIGAVVNGQRVPLSYPLKSGERVEILTDPASTPKLSWLNQHKNYATTARANSTIRSWLKTYYKDIDNAQLINSDNLSGVGGHKVEAALCCQPQLGDKIMGVYQPDASILVHRATCPNASKSKHGLPILELEWGEKTDNVRQTIHIEAFDRSGLLQDITTLLSQTQANILTLHSVTDTTDQSVAIDLLIELSSAEMSHHLLKRLEYITNVFKAELVEG
ncbi:MAG: GTP pyrophosphokinase (EC, (p)ppGpp synthetase I [uncultured Thiotrichaceae bacterium]|uniref:GTP pyrophosphokinase n=1 Tax=uncultured Thiotrichaceae bacterium TaxID=298394 RepID=A0A6S6T075_9GAMM|nr:MAG: GTP pyrophosphokinase (EC, (p)ppGpp synthetase I [uncultured Thiotrichaceae bacterium]